MIKISPSILGINRLNLKQEISKILETGYVDMLHIDVMDGVFVPNFALDIATVADVQKEFDVPLDVHLMIEYPHKYIEKFAEAMGGDARSILTFHVESSSPVEETIDAIRKTGVMPGISLKPHTQVSSIEEFIPKLDSVLQMTVEPGFGGQSLIEEALGNIPKLCEMMGDKIIAVDGGVTAENARRLVGLGVNMLCIGSAFWKVDLEGLKSR